MRRIVAAYLLGCAVLSLTGFFCPWWFLGFVPLGVGVIYAALELIDDAEDSRGDIPRTPR